MFLKSLFLCLLIFILGCSQKVPSTPTKINLIQSLKSLSESFPGGLYLSAYHREREKYFIKKLDSNSTTIELESGSWDMTVIGWNQSRHAFEGEMNCDVKNSIRLDGEDANIDFSISPEGCAHPLISPTPTLSEDYRSASGTPKPIRFDSCFDIEDGLRSDPTISLSPTGFDCSSDGGGIMQSYRVKVYESPYSNDPTTSKINPVQSRCYSFSANQHIESNIKLPLGIIGPAINPPKSGNGIRFPVVVESYPNINCQGSPVEHEFPYGLLSGDINFKGFAQLSSKDSFTSPLDYITLFLDTPSSYMEEFLISDIRIFSNNATNNQFAKNGDLVELQFVAIGDQRNFTLKINGNSVEVTDDGDGHYSATYSIDVTDPEGSLEFELSYLGFTFNQTTNNSSITIDRTAPSTPNAAILKIPSSSPSNDTTPTFTISGIENGNRVKLYTDASCTTEIGSSISNGSSVNITSSVLAIEQVYNIYAKQFDKAGNESLCSNSLEDYELLLTPTITSISPSAGVIAGNTNVTITGNGFYPGVSVSIGGSHCTNVNVVNINTITCKTGAQAAPGLVNVSITNSDGNSVTLAGAYAYAIEPTILSIYPPFSDINGDTTLIITGTNFSTSTVTIGGVPCVIESQAAGTITCTTGANDEGAHDVVVGNTGGLSVTENDGVTYQEAFISIWNVPASTEITLPLNESYDYNFYVDWGDSSPISHHVVNDSADFADPSNNFSHFYTLGNSYTIKILGTVPAWYFNNGANHGGDKDLIEEVTNLGDVGWLDLSSAFYGCSNLTSFEGGNVSNVINMNLMFAQAPQVDPDTSTWDTGNVTNMANMFFGADGANPDVSNWDVSNVTNFTGMFKNANLANPDVSEWDVSSATTMQGMFENTDLANPDVSRWDVSNVTNMANMFKATSIAEPNTSDWDTGNVTNMTGMFSNAVRANPNVTNWDVSNVVNMSFMFHGTVVADPDVSNWITTSATSFESMFQDAVSANPVTTSWDLDGVTDMSFMFSGSAINVQNWSDFLHLAKDTDGLNNITIDSSAQHNNDAKNIYIPVLQSRLWTINDAGLAP